jgi:hypothetical protein
MLQQRATSTHKIDKTEETAPLCLQSIHSDNVGLAQYELIHQFKEGCFPNVTVALGTTKALFLEEFFTQT